MGIVDQAEEFHRLDDAHHAGILLFFNGLGDEASDVATEDIIAIVSRNLDNLCRWFGDLISLAVDDDETLCRFGTTGKQLGDAYLQRIGEALKFRDSGIALDASKQIADRSAHTVCDVGESQALGLDDLSQVLFYVCHVILNSDGKIGINNLLSK